jgi:predicted permease
VDLHRDVLFGLRMLRKNSLLVIVASLSLGLGIGLNATVFSAVHAALFRAPAIERADDLVNLYSAKDGVRDYNPFSYADFVDLRDGMRSLDALVGHSLAMVNYERGGLPTLQFGAIVTSGYFDLLETRPALGRVFRDDDFAEQNPVVVVSHRFWREELAADPASIGMTARLGQRIFEIVGVLPEDFTGFSRGLAPDIFVPITLVAAGIQPMGEIDVEGRADGRSIVEWRGYRFMNVTGRLAPGATLEQAATEANSLAAALAAEFPDSNRTRGVALRESSAVRFDPELDGVLVPVAMLMLTLVGLVLIVACGNVANLLLAKAQARGSEMALRTALGASRTQIVRQLLVESALYGVICGAVGLLVAAVAIQLFGLFRVDLPVQPRVALRLDAPVVVFTIVLSLATTLLFGLIPARHAGRLALVPLLRSAGTMLGGRRWFHPANLQVVGQVAASVVLVVVAGLMSRSVGEARGVEVGFETERLGAVEIQFRGTDTPAAELPALWQRIKSRIEALPGIEAAALTSRLPLGASLVSDDFFVPGLRESETDPPIRIDIAGVDDDYFATLGLELVAGRSIDARDRLDTPLVAVVTEATVRRLWPGESGLGKRVRFGTSDSPEVEIVGVVRDYKIRTPGESPRPMVHFAWHQRLQMGGILAYRSSGAADTALEQVVAAARAEAPGMLLVQSTTMSRMRELLLLPLRVGSVAAVALGSLALFLAILGLSGLILYWVTHRSREIGLRIALGAPRSSVLRLVASRTLALIGGGLILGGAASVVLGRLLEPALYVPGFDPVSLTIGVAVLLVAGAIASVVPVRRAASIDPMTVLRQD